MGGFFDFLGTLVKTGAVTVGVAAAAVAGILYATKPDEKMLKKDIESAITDAGPTGVHLIDKAASKVVTNTSTKNVKDYVFVKTADVTTIDGDKQTYIGAFQHWFPISTN
jgi:hypothetical protein